ncbi:PaaI family thioesterase [Sneathiella glossodoripedis]|uniref:PaaI family thioesterase n=1 Tax=Sneathiella glossodoripedis TaxID=418853 RepID=UPI00046E97B6|nr:PaaI family thioesterase [Sneathiella glossodoripedis]
MTNKIPEGFVPFPEFPGFLETTGPLYVNYTDTEARLGILVEKKHVNIANICHGGMIMTLADMQLGIGAQAALKMRKFLPTMHMSGDFVAPTPLGAWLEGRTEVIKATRKSIFATCILKADGETVFSGSGIMKIPGDNGGQFADIMISDRG